MGLRARRGMLARDFCVVSDSGPSKWAEPTSAPQTGNDAKFRFEAIVSINKIETALKLVDTHVNIFDSGP
jgi:hypothetical protein